MLLTCHECKGKNKLLICCICWAKYSSSELCDKYICKNQAGLNRSWPSTLLSLWLTHILAMTQTTQLTYLRVTPPLCVCVNVCYPWLIIGRYSVRKCFCDHLNHWLQTAPRPHKLTDSIIGCGWPAGGTTAGHKMQVGNRALIRYYHWTCFYFINFYHFLFTHCFRVSQFYLLHEIMSFYQAPLSYNTEI